MIRLSDRPAHTRPVEFNGWNIYESRPNPECECRRLSIGAAYSSHQSSGFSPCVRAHTHFSIFHSTWSNSPVCTAEWHSHSSGIRHSISNFAFAIHAIPRCFSTESNIILPSRCHPLHTQLFLVFRVSVGHLVTSFASIPSANLCATRGFALCKAYSACSRHLLSGELARRLKMPKRIYGGF